MSGTPSAESGIASLPSARSTWVRARMQPSASPSGLTWQASATRSAAHRAPTASLICFFMPFAHFSGGAARRGGGQGGHALLAMRLQVGLDGVQQLEDPLAARDAFVEAELDLRRHPQMRPPGELAAQ